jgi:hypothetical protein
VNPGYLARSLAIPHTYRETGIVTEGSSGTDPPIHQPKIGPKAPKTWKPRREEIAMRITRILLVAIVLMLAGMMLVAVDNEPVNLKIEYFKAKMEIE